MAYTTIDDPELYFQVKTYTGTGSSNAVTFDGENDMQPDLVWIKERGGTEGHQLFDAVRGQGKDLHTNSTDSESDSTTRLTAFGSNGFTVVSDDSVNGSSKTYVAWCWKESSTSGVDVALYTGNATAGHTASHSLGVAPNVVIVKSRSVADGWAIFWKRPEAGNPIILGLDNALADRHSTRYSPFFNSTAPTSSVFTLGSDTQVNTDNSTNVGFCFAEKQGFSKFGKYVGNGNSNGPCVWTGFRPAFIMFKPIGESSDWTICDTKRNTHNPTADSTINANLTTGDHDGGMDFDILSTGFKVRNANTDNNSSNSAGIVYMAFAEQPFVNSKGVPANAR